MYTFLFVSHHTQVGCESITKVPATSLSCLLAWSFVLYRGYNGKESLTLPPLSNWGV